MPRSFHGSDSSHIDQHRQCFLKISEKAEICALRSLGQRVTSAVLEENVELFD
jgi:hypothetical protein